MTAFRTIIFSFLLSTFGSLFGSDVLRVGADRVSEPPYLHWFEGRRLGLVTNVTGVGSQFRPTAELLEEIKGARVVAFFAPEHGLEGHLQAGETVPATTSIYSLYGTTRRPTPKMLKEIEVLVYDIQDVGVRFYTYISTLFESMKACADQGIPLIVLDRPNPIRGDRLEGPVLEPGKESFIGPHQIPIRYGMTPGEVASLLNAEVQLECDLRIVPLQGWSRRTWYDQNDLLWIPPSPNMPSLETAILYPGFALIEGTNLSEGRGTTRPFELVGAPWLKNYRLARRLNAFGLPGVHIRPQAFTPTFSKYRNQRCRGIQIHVLDRNRFQPITAALHLLAEARKLHPQKMVFHQRQFDRLCGNSWIRESLKDGVPIARIVQKWKSRLLDFQDKRARHLLYP